MFELFTSISYEASRLLSVIGADRVAFSDLILIFLLNAFSTTLGNLKTVFLSRKMERPVYITTFLDAVLVAYAFKLISNSAGLLFIVSFAMGRLFGVYLANIIEEKLALGMLEVTIYKHQADGILLADLLRDLGYSVTTLMGYGLNGNQRLLISVVVPRKNLPELKEILKDNGNINMAVKDVHKTYGKVGRVRAS
ncbi:MAG: hypothetical protein ACM3MK_02035 [Chitinophagales bacterium]